MQRSQRQKLIITSVDSGFRSVEDLVTLTGASAITVRRDLAELSERGSVQRVRGGAAPVPSRGARYPFELRQAERAPTKRALAGAAAGLVEPGDCVLIDNGTTALAVARELAGRGVTALALSLHAAAALASKPGNQVIVPGGTVRHDDLSFTPASAERAIRDMRFDYAFVGSCAARLGTGLTVADWGEAQVKRAALTAAHRTVLVAAGDKFSRTAANHFGDLADLDTIVTTSDAPRDVIAEARILGLTLITVDIPENDSD
ncbi:DeoR/GlpR family DNA-binding transcription regulator [Micropruina sp.]|uniref:DeoR/GlpR family DNA-binding transcription regulator n=1 Tax=Micropruina sp. TaxID=2737536 RepID=UPI0039E530A1